MATTRRTFLQLAAGGALAGLGDLAFLRNLPQVSAAEARLKPDAVRLSDDIEPLVRLLEETPREQLLEKVADRIRGGTSYREVLAALLLAGVRNVEPRPSVGFKFHAVLVVNSAHLASISSPDEHRWLPIFWALDYFKSAQARDESERGWTMAPVDESAVPPPHNARDEFIAALESWDEARADAAVAGLVRAQGPLAVYEPLFRYGARDFRSIGHKAIFVANSWRTLNCIGQQYAEPVLRSLTYALLMHEGRNPAEYQDQDADRPGRDNLQRLEQVRKDWQIGKVDQQATAELVSTLYDGSVDDVCDLVVEQLNAGVSPQSVWDGMFVGAGELLARQSGIVALHSLTTSNALHFAYQTAADDRTRRYCMLQNAAFLPMFREAMRGRGKVRDLHLADMQPAELPEAADQAIEQIFAATGRDNDEAARLTLAYAAGQSDPRKFIDAARVLVFLKGEDSHDYKFSSAVLEDCLHVSPQWRDKYLAASVYNLRGAKERDNPLVERTRSALG